MKIAVVGATGMVGTIMMKLLEERNFPVSELIPVASERSVGKIVTFKDKEYKIVGLELVFAFKNLLEPIKELEHGTEAQAMKMLYSTSDKVQE